MFAGLLNGAENTTVILTRAEQRKGRLILSEEGLRSAQRCVCQCQAKHASASLRCMHCTVLLVRGAGTESSFVHHWDAVIMPPELADPGQTLLPVYQIIHTYSLNHLIDYEYSSCLT